MIDFRLESFLTLYKELSYTKTAEKLHISQPNVSQHIKFLEEYYQAPLFIYKNRKLIPTRAGKNLYLYVSKLKSDSLKFREEITRPRRRENLRFGTTLTVGDYIMPKILDKLDYKKFSLSMKIANTRDLLESLDKGDLDFLIIEGHFNRADYNSVRFSREKFIGIGPNSYDDTSYRLEDILNHRLILREDGSGTRETFKHILFDNNLSLDSFKDIIELPSIKLIKDLVAGGVGISFMYEMGALDYINKGLIKPLNIIDFSIFRDINFIFLKNSYFNNKYLDILDTFKVHYNY